MSRDSNSKTSFLAGLSDSIVATSMPVSRPATWVPESPLSSSVPVGPSPSGGVSISMLSLADGNENEDEDDVTPAQPLQSTSQPSPPDDEVQYADDVVAPLPMLPPLPTLPAVGSSSSVTSPQPPILLPGQLPGRLFLGLNSPVVRPVKDATPSPLPSLADYSPFAQAPASSYAEPRSPTPYMLQPRAVSQTPPTAMRSAIPLLPDFSTYMPPPGGSPYLPPSVTGAPAQMSQTHHMQQQALLYAAPNLLVLKGPVRDIFPRAPLAVSVRMEEPVPVPDRSAAGTQIVRRKSSVLSRTAAATLAKELLTKESTKDVGSDLVTVTGLPVTSGVAREVSVSLAATEAMAISKPILPPPKPARPPSPTIIRYEITHACVN